MQQQDITELEQDEVDWKRGRIARKRSKTEHHGNGLADGRDFGRRDGRASVAP
jgi:hypothetical protein